jgi:c-di-GMP-binding flagellar brake protein YcgR
MKATTEVAACPGLFPGVQIQMQLEGLGPAKVTFIGIADGEYLILKTPPIQEIGTKLYEKNHVIIRYFHAGSVYGFRCTLIGLIKEPCRLSILSYPESVECLNLRKHERIDCLIKATVHLAGVSEESFRGAVYDISMGGCGLKLKQEDSQAFPKIEIGGKAVLFLDLRGREEPMAFQSVIRRVQQDREVVLLGLEFEDEEKGKENVLEIIREHMDPFGQI